MLAPAAAPAPALCPPRLLLLSLLANVCTLFYIGWTGFAFYTLLQGAEPHGLWVFLTIFFAMAAAGAREAAEQLDRTLGLQPTAV